MFSLKGSNNKKSTSVFSNHPFVLQPIITISSYISSQVLLQHTSTASSGTQQALEIRRALKERTGTEQHSIKVKYVCGQNRWYKLLKFKVKRILLRLLELSLQLLYLWYLMIINNQPIYYPPSLKKNTKWNKTSLVNIINVIHSLSLSQRISKILDWTYFKRYPDLFYFKFRYWPNLI